MQDHHMACRISECSPDRLRRNPAAAYKSATAIRDFASLHPGYQPRHFNLSRPLPIVIDRQHLAADRLGRVGGEEHCERRDVRRLDHRLDRLRGHRLGAH
jgi:hypothetical protein